MSSLSPRVAIAIAIAVVLPGTILAISQLALVPVDTASFKPFQQRISFDNTRGEPAKRAHLESPRESLNVSRAVLRSIPSTKTPIAPVRRAPTILGPIDQRLPNSRVFALKDDPFVDVTLSDQIRAVESNSAAAISQVKSPGRPRHVRSVTIEPHDPMIHPSSTDSVVAIPCQPADVAISVPTPCIEFDLFSNLRNRIFPHFRESPRSRPR